MQDLKFGDPVDQKGGFFVVHQDLVAKHDMIVGRGWTPSCQVMQQFARDECGIGDVLNYMFTDR